MRLLESKVTGMQINKVLCAFTVSCPGEGRLHDAGGTTVTVHLLRQLHSQRPGETMGNSGNEPRLDWDQCVTKSVKVASQTNLFAWYFQLSEFHNIPTQDSLFQKQKGQHLHCSAGSGDFFSFLFFLNLTYLFYFWLHWVFVAAQVFLFHLVVKEGSCCSLTASHCGAFYCCRAQALGHMGFSSFGTQAQQSRVAASRSRAQQLWPIGLVALWHVDLPAPGIKPVPPALAGRFISTMPPGKPHIL